MIFVHVSECAIDWGT